MKFEGFHTRTPIQSLPLNDIPLTFFASKATDNANIISRSSAGWEQHSIDDCHSNWRHCSIAHNKFQCFTVESPFIPNNIIPKTNNKIPKPQTEEKKKEAIQENTIKNLVVSFYSIGSGIDYKSAEKFEQFLNTFTLENGSKPVYEKIGWGREGEIDYFIALEGWKYSEAKTFV